MYDTYQAVSDTAKHMSNTILGEIRKIIQEEIAASVKPMFTASSERLIEQVILKLSLDPQLDAKALFKKTEERLRAFPDIVLRMQTEDFYYPQGRSQSVMLSGIRHGRMKESEVQETIEKLAIQRRARDAAEVDAIKKAWKQVENDVSAGYVWDYYFEGKSRKEIAEATNYDTTTVWRKMQSIVKRLAVILYGAEAV